MKKKLKCVAINKNANNTATAVFHETDEKGKVVFAVQVTSFNPADVDALPYQGFVSMEIIDLLEKSPVE